MAELRPPHDLIQALSDVRAVSTDVIPAVAFPAEVDCPKASEIIVSVRDLIPDPVYDPNTGDPMPDGDGQFLRASTLYRWLTAGIREVTRRANWLIHDWTAQAQLEREGVYGFDYKYVNVDACYCNMYRLMHLDEVHTIYPSVAVAQPLWFSWHHRSDRLELALWPYCDRSDPRPSLWSSMDPVTTSMDLPTTEGFLPNGYVRVEGELMHYSALAQDLDPQAAPGLRLVRRGVGGTSATTHFAGQTVEHLSIWVRGWRAPKTVVRSTDCVELPYAFQHPLETFLLARVKEAEQLRQEASSLMQEFVAEVSSIVDDPTWQTPPCPMQARAYGAPQVGSLAWGRVLIP